MGDNRPTVAAHSFTVAQTAQLLGRIEETEFRQVINWKELYEKALNHDFKEAYTGDIKGPIKNHNPEVKAHIETIEEIFANDMLYSQLSPVYADMYKHILSNGKDNTIEGQILKAADSIDLLMECLNEIQAGNPSREFQNAYVDGVRKLKRIELGSVQCFLTTILQELLDSAEELVNIKAVTASILYEE